MKFKDIKIKNKIIIIVISAIVISVGVVGTYSLVSTILNSQVEIKNYEKELMHQTRQKLKDIIDSSYTVIEKSYTNSSTVKAIKKDYGNELKSLTDIPFALIQKEYSQMSKRDRRSSSARRRAQINVKKAIKEIRYSGSNYFWIHNTNVRMVMHPILPKLNGRDLSAFSKNGKLVKAEGTESPMFKEMVRVCQNSPTNDGFVSYFWPSPTDTTRWALFYLKFQKNYFTIILAVL